MNSAMISTSDKYSEMISTWESVGPPLDGEWLVSLEQKLADTNWEPWRTDQASIFRVPYCIREDNAKLYDPKVVSLGPYHRDVDHLLPMNRLKWHCLKKFLGRNPRNTLVYYLRHIQDLENRARAAYADDLSSMPSNDFVQMMLLDGCFIVETVLLWKYGVSGLEAMQNPIASSPWILPMVARDMLMLENQVPFFLLQRLFEYGYAFPRRLDFAEYAVEFFAVFADMDDLELPPDGPGKGGFCHLLHLFHSCINPGKNAGEAPGKGGFCHLLHLFHSCINPGKNAGEAPGKGGFCHLLHLFHSCINSGKNAGEANPMLKISSPKVKSIPSATRLTEAGVKFKRKWTKKKLDITFHNGKMQIPQLAVNGHINKLFRNLIAFEQGYRCASRHVTSYASLMDSIIDTPADVTLLQKGDIIVNELGDNEDVAALFNKLCSGAAIDDGSGYLASVFEEANRHYNRQWNQFLSILRRDYFGNPWSAIALMAAILLFCLTSTQTVYSVLAYVQPQKN